MLWHHYDTREIVVLGRVFLLGGKKDGRGKGKGEKKKRDKRKGGRMEGRSRGRKEGEEEKRESLVNGGKRRRRGKF